MGKQTGIEWCDATYNPWRGCEHVSEGCKFCYAEKQAKRNPRVLGEWGKDKPRAFAVPSYIVEALKMQERAARGVCPNCFGRSTSHESDGRCHVCGGGTVQLAPYRLRVFCGSMMDVWEHRPDLAEPRAGLLDTIARTPNLDWLLLSKRPQNFERCLLECLELCTPPALMLACSWLSAFYYHNRIDRTPTPDMLSFGGHNAHGVAAFVPRVPPNVWVGWTVENNRRANERCEAGLRIPAGVRFVSAEPLLDLPELRPYLGLDLVSWVIVGGESGAKARPFDPDWARCLFDQSQDAGVAFFMKQMGDKPLGLITLGMMQDEWNGIPHDIRVRQFPTFRAQFEFPPA